MKKISFALAGAALLTSVATPVFAATLMEEEHVAISLPISDDLYAVGEKVTIAEQISGDVIAAGGNIEVNARVSEDLIAAGGQIAVKAAVGDDIRVAGGEVEIASTVAGDVIVFGGSITIAEGAVINGDVIALGGDIEIFGDIRGSLRIYGGRVRIDGTVLGEAHIEAENLMVGGTFGGEASLAAVDLGVGLDARFNQNVTYWTEDGKMDFGDTLGPNAEATYDPDLRTIDLPHKAQAAGALAVLLGVLSIFSILSAALIIFILVLATNKLFPTMAAKIDRKPLWCLLIGLLFFICTPILGVLLLVTIIGIPLGLYALMIFAFSVYFSKILTAMTFAKWIELRSKSKWNKAAFFFLSVLLFVVLKILTLIPIVGWILKAILIFMAFGALLMYKADAWKKWA